MIKKAMFIVVLLPLAALAQKEPVPQKPSPEAMHKMMDSIKMHYLDEAAIDYPLIRQVYLNTDVFAQSRISSKLRGSTSPFYKGDNQAVQTSVAVNLPLLSWKSNALSVNLGFVQQDANLTNVESYDAAIPVANHKTDVGTAIFGLTYSRMDSVFGKQLLSSVNIGGMSSNPSSVQKVAYMGTFLYTIKRTAVTTIMVGGVVLFDKSTPVHFLPIINYHHAFSPGTDLYIDLPQRAMLRRRLSAKSWLWIGSDLTSSVAFLNIDNPVFPRTDNYSSFEIKSGVGYERRLTDKMIIGCRAGVMTPFSGRLFEKGESSDNYILTSDLRTMPFVSISLSLLPFLNSFIRK